jgi:hypothetical protein
MGENLQARWLNTLPEMLAHNNLGELVRMASIADDVHAMVDRCNDRIAALELDLAARYYGEGGLDITKLVTEITAGATMTKVFYNTSALTRPLTPSGPQCYVVVTPDRARALNEKGERVSAYYDLHVWTRRAESL